MDLLEITDSKSKIHKHFLDDGSGKILKHINICTGTYSIYLIPLLSSVLSFSTQRDFRRVWLFREKGRMEFLCDYCCLI